MDSGNSGSVQSSSGGDEEYDSRSESISAFLNSSSNGMSHVSNLHPPATYQKQPHQVFDPLPNYLDAFSRSPATPNMNALLNLDAVWGRGQQSDPNCTNVGGLIGSSSLRSDHGPFSSVNNTMNNNININSSSGNCVGPSMQLPQGSENVGQPNAGRNPKKRSRASRRAPTTVLTTDTSNFRAMVQEFTGIPAPPFSASSFSKARIDLFNTASSMRSALSNPTLPPYLLRPFAQKVTHQPPMLAPIFSSLPLAASSSLSSSSSSSPSTTITSTTTAAANNSSYLMLGDLGLLKDHTNLLNMQNPSFGTLPSLLQNPSPKYPLASLPSFAAKSQEPSSATIPSMGSHLKMGLLDDFGLNHENVNTLPNLVTSDAMSLAEGNRDQLRSFNGNYSNSQRGSSCKMNYTGSSSDFHADKGSDNVSSRGEGMVDSWICSTD